MATFCVNKIDAESHPSIWKEIKKNRQFKSARAAYSVMYNVGIVGVYPTLKKAEMACHKYARDKLHSSSVKIVRE